MWACSEPWRVRVWKVRNRIGLQRIVRRKVVAQLRAGDGRTVPDLTQQLGLSSGRIQLALWDLEREGVARQCTEGSRVLWLKLPDS